MIGECPVPGKPSVCPSLALHTKPPFLGVLCELCSSTGQPCLVPCSVQSYISSEGQSLRSTKEFLQPQSRSLRPRRSALRAASLQWHHNLHRAQGAEQDPNSSQLLQGMCQNREEVSPGRCLCSVAQASPSPGTNPWLCGPVGVGLVTLWK